MARFYNPGTVIDERMPYTHPTKDPKDGNTLSYFALKAEEREFFEVPDTFTIQTPEGDVTLSVNFSKRIKQLHAERGVILVDESLKKIAEDDNAAATDAAAVKKGAAMWKEYLKNIVTRHYTAVAEIKQGGGVPRAAKGLTSYALKVLGYDDPADVVDTIARVKESQTENAELMTMLRSMQRELDVLKGAQGTKAEGGGGPSQP